MNSQVVELIPNGSKVAVTNSNKLRYLDALAQYKLANNIKEEVESFLKGLNELIPDNLLSIFDENELEVHEVNFIELPHFVTIETFCKLLNWSKCAFAIII